MLPAQNPIRSHRSWFMLFTGQRFFNKLYTREDGVRYSSRTTFLRLSHQPRSQALRRIEYENEDLENIAWKLIS